MSAMTVNIIVITRVSKKNTTVAIAVTIATTTIFLTIPTISIKADTPTITTVITTKKAHIAINTSTLAPTAKDHTHQVTIARIKLVKYYNKDVNLNVDNKQPRPQGRADNDPSQPAPLEITTPPPIEQNLALKDQLVIVILAHYAEPINY